MNSNMIMQMMFQTHQYYTENQPITFNEIELPSAKLFREAYQPQHGTEGTPKQIIQWLRSTFTSNVIEELMYLFKLIESKYTTVNVNPVHWINVVLMQLSLSLESTEEKMILKIPNGCCNNPNCPLKKFYEIVGNHLANQVLK